VYEVKGKIKIVLDYDQADEVTTDVLKETIESIKVELKRLVRMTEMDPENEELYQEDIEYLNQTLVNMLGTLQYFLPSKDFTDYMSGTP
jgi:hypothetical protein